MNKRFNISGTCIPEKHYIADLTQKITATRKMVDAGDYFTINRPRQYGKTTVLFILEKELHDEYIVINLSFEGLGELPFQSEVHFCPRLLYLFADNLYYAGEELMDFLRASASTAGELNAVSKVITEFVRLAPKRVLLIIDEVDKCSNNQVFLDFLGMLRHKYLKMNEGKDCSFHSVILAGIQDIKNLKTKIRNDGEKKYNSPWNIAVNFNVDMSLNPGEIASMLADYCRDRGVSMDLALISEKLHRFTSGYPFLVSRLCRIMDEELPSAGHSGGWTVHIVEEAVRYLLKETNTNFDDLIKNIENNTELAELVRKVVLDGIEQTFNIHHPEINLGVRYGIFKESGDRLRIHNWLYEQLIYNYMSAKLENCYKMDQYTYKNDFILPDYSLDMEKILVRFQQFIHEQYSKKNLAFLEREGRLMFLAFIKPIINGNGFDFKEVQISDEKRLDVVITYLQHKYIVELKIWRGAEAHERGKRQLADYLERTGLAKGYLLIFDFSTKRYKESEPKREMVDGKEIFSIWLGRNFRVRLRS